MPDRGLFVARVTRRRSLCRDHFEVSLRIEGFPEAHPGQFIQIRCRPAPAANGTAESPGEALFRRTERAPDATSGPVLRRPFSIAGLRRGANDAEIDIIGRVVGPGTAFLSALERDDAVDLLGPLGRGFRAPPRGHRALLVAGGVGLPPIRWWGEVLRRTNVACAAVCGARQRDLLPLTLLAEPAGDGAFSLCVEEFARVGIATSVMTDDGSCGAKGTVTDGLLRHIAQSEAAPPPVVYACGPAPMLQGVGALCNRRGIRCALALERMMGCGMGTCQSCVVRIADAGDAAGWRYALSCTEGPVFDARDVLW